MKVEFYRHNIGSREIQSLTSVLRTLFLTTGAVTEQFERRFARHLGCSNVVGVNSCTAGLHLSLYALGVGPGDEVITSPLSFYATANAIMYTGAKPVFVDVEEDTGLINPALIEKALTKRTKAIVPVHMYGQMCDMKQIARIARKYTLKIVEDSALCIDAQRDGFMPGAKSDTACFSFHAIKSITSGEGGAVATNNTELAKHLRFCRLHGIGRSVVERHNDPAKRQDMHMFGYKCNMYDLQAALLINQLKRVVYFTHKRQSHYDLYERMLRPLPAVRLPRIAKNSRSEKTLFTIWVPPAKRNDYLYALQKAGIGVDVKYHPIHLSTYYRKSFGYKPGDFPEAEHISSSTITLPLYPKLRRKEIAYVVDVLRKVMSNV